jgi:hypothetical protein
MATIERFSLAKIDRTHVMPIVAIEPTRFPELPSKEGLGTVHTKPRGLE